MKETTRNRKVGETVKTRAVEMRGKDLNSRENGKRNGK